MDIDGYTFHEHLTADMYEDQTKKHRVYAEMCYFFYHLFHTNGFFEFYNQYFVSPYVDAYLDLYLDRMHRRGEEISKSRHELVKIVSGPYRKEAKAYIEKQVVQKKEFWSAEKYLGNILEVIGLK